MSHSAQMKDTSLSILNAPPTSPSPCAFPPAPPLVPSHQPLPLCLPTSPSPCALPPAPPLVPFHYDGPVVHDTAGSVVGAPGHYHTHHDSIPQSTSSDGCWAELPGVPQRLVTMAAVQHATLTWHPLSSTDDTEMATQKTKGFCCGPPVVRMGRGFCCERPGVCLGLALDVHCIYASTCHKSCLGGPSTTHKGTAQ